MIHVSDIMTTPPASYKTDLQKQVYETLSRLCIPYQRVDTDEVITMEDCAEIDKKLDMHMVKTLFLCDRQQEHFYLFITCGDKPFRSKDFAAALGVSRLSFAPAEKMEVMLGTKIGAATVFSVLLSSARDVRVVFDAQVVAQPWYGCSDGTTTGYMKLATQDVCRTLLHDAGRTLETVEL